MNELIYPHDENWMTILFWINENLHGKVSVEGIQTLKIHGTEIPIFVTRHGMHLVKFQDENDALICKIKFPPSENKNDNR